MEESPHHSTDGYKKKKKKRSFFQNAKKFGRSGNYGKGRQLSEEEYKYYMTVLQQLKIVDGEEKYSLIKNFFRELSREGEERSLSSNQIVSRILDDLLPLAPVSQVVHLCTVFESDLRTLCVDPFASHVIQTLLTLALKYIQVGATQYEPFSEEESDDKNIPVSSENQEKLKAFVIKVSKFVYNNLDEFIYDTYASHIIRSVLEVSSGVEVDKSIKSSNKSQTSHALRQKTTDVLNVPKDLSVTLVDVLIRLTRVPNIPDIIYNECGSAILQCALIVAEVKESDHCETLVQHLLDHGLCQLGSDYDVTLNVDIHNAFTSHSCVRLLEVMVGCCTPKQQKELYDQIFKDQVIHLVKHSIGNFALQKLLKAWKDKETFEELYEEVSNTLPDALACNHTGVIWSLTQACGKLKSHQSRCIQAFMKLMECAESETKQINIASLLLYLTPDSKYSKFKSNNTLPPLSLHGSLILQEFLGYQKPIKVVNSILAMSDSEIITMASSPKGSHVIDAYVNSPTVGEKSREKIIHKFYGSYPTLACCRHGSRTVDALWHVANIKAKSQICSEFLSSESKLKSNQYGNILYVKFQVRLFKRSGAADDWLDFQTRECRKRKMLTDLLDTDSNEKSDTTPKSKRKKKHKDNVSIDTGTE